MLIGIGLNVNQTEFDEEIQDIASSIKTEFNINIEREELIAEFCNQFEIYCKQKGIIQ